ncbi:E3 ubiquitin-protein ligase DZIP3-like [Mercenaria mercenaria]|uniref:E3 ubiquitin-protein ligase DZIP3-like n=1 Tax=Mercenaria mercenaria TaxID=6596 RepID=UPI00234E654E|nr:E3 ubiquitin-protein ligase DZIP3-like [Mercenaria mercenaria]
MGRGKNSSEMPNNPEETRNFLIFLAVFIDIATETVLKVFYHEVPKHTFHSFVSTGNIDGILKKTLSKRQYYLVKSNKADPDRFDFSILFTLLRIALTPPSAGWDQKPAPTDVSVAADILRLRYLRNKIVAHRHKATLSTYDFIRYFGELEAVIFRLSGSEEQQHVAKKIESYKKVILDYSNKEFYLNKPQEWHDDLQQKVQELLSETESYLS